MDAIADFADWIIDPVNQTLITNDGLDGTESNIKAKNLLGPTLSDGAGPTLLYTLSDRAGSNLNNINLPEHNLNEVKNHSNKKNMRDNTSSTRDATAYDSQLPACKDVDISAACTADIVGNSFLSVADHSTFNATNWAEPYIQSDYGNKIKTDAGCNNCCQNDTNYSNSCQNDTNCSYEYQNSTKYRPKNGCQNATYGYCCQNDTNYNYRCQNDIRPISSDDCQNGTNSSNGYQNDTIYRHGCQNDANYQNNVQTAINHCAGELNQIDNNGYPNDKNYSNGDQSIVDFRFHHSDYGKTKDCGDGSNQYHSVNYEKKDHYGNHNWPLAPSLQFNDYPQQCYATIASYPQQCYATTASLLDTNSTTKPIDQVLNTFEAYGYNSHANTYAPAFNEVASCSPYPNFCPEKSFHRALNSCETR